ncbi:MAG: diacylglycerol kinase family protein, partial [Rubricoccaceae bacterium]|nr:diacylglycerol kinase family protein [Rubricoccaceae bacterium]
MRYAVVLNPAAQNGRAGRQRAAIEAALRVENVRFDLYVTERPGHATLLAQQAAPDADVVLAVGGDGTVQEVVQGLHGSEAALGVLPLGTGNDFAYALGVPETLWEALQALLTAPVRTIDLGRVYWEDATDDALGGHERLFANCLGVGFDALVARNARRFKRLGGRTAYHAAVFRTL